MRKISAIVIILFVFSVFAEEPVPNVKNFRNRTEYISLSITGSAMGLGLAISSPTLKWKYIFWEIINTEGVFPTFGYFTFGVAGYTKVGYYHYFTTESEVRIAVGAGGGYFTGDMPSIDMEYDKNCNYSNGSCWYYGFYMQPEISYVHNFNEKYALQIGAQFPLIFPRFFPYPYKLFIGFRY